MMSRRVNLEWLLTMAAVIAFLGGVLYLGAFKLLDRDFWWHITAGELMVRTQSLIETEPFAYTRFGEPYVATHEWLAQVVLYLIHEWGGPAAIIAFRTLVTAATFGVLLLLNRRQVWINIFIALYAAAVTQPGFIERPQLFTFLILAAFLAVTLRILDQGVTWRSAILLWVLQVLWVNTHGAASVVGFVVFGAAVLSEVFAYCWRHARGQALAPRALWQLGGAGVGLLLATLVSPSTYHNFTYLFNLLQDRTIIFINEWRPRPWSEYWFDLTPLWALAILAIAATRRHFFFMAVILAALGYMSRQAVRHEMLLVIAATGIIIYELRYNERLTEWLKRLESRPRQRLGLWAALLVVLAVTLQSHYRNFAQRDHLYGYGVFDLARGAYDFIERNNLTGNMFNTYGIGGYLMHRGYQERPIYIDGRNVDYGFVFMSRTFLAGKQPKQWQKLDERYNFSYAVIDYDANTDTDPPLVSYSVHLDTNPEWKLVYVDDWVAIYVKNTPAHQDLIQRYQYEVVTVSDLHFKRLLTKDDPLTHGVLVRELERIVSDNPQGIKARLALAQLYRHDKRLDEARAILEAARDVQPYRSEIYEALADLHLAEQDFVEAAKAYDSMLAFAGKAYPDLNYKFIAEVYRRAGRPYKARYLEFRAKPETSPAGGALESSPTPVVTPSNQAVSDIINNLGRDIEHYNEEGIELAAQRKYQLAEESFLTALKLDPSHPTTLTNLGALAQQQGESAQALEYYTRALEADPEYADAHYNLATVLYQQGKYREALAAARQAETFGRDASLLIARIRQHL